MDTSGRRSTNVEDRRRMGGGRMVAAGGVGTLVLLLVGSLLGVDPQILSALSQGLEQGAPIEQGGAPPADDPAAAFASVVLASTEDVWGARFQAEGVRYPEPTLVLFTDRVQSACGAASAQVGPFYCPGDQKLYLDLDFLNALTRQLGARGDFAQAYVIAHEIGHHVENLRGELGGRGGNAESVQVELRADCYAGVWAHDAQQVLHVVQDGDIEEAMRAASAVGDDRLQQMAGQAVRPESFTHGSSMEREQAFTMGYRTGQIEACAR